MSLIKAKGVDICVHNGDVDFEILKAYGVQFVMIGMGDRFHENVRKAEAAGMPWGAYYYTYSLSAAEDEQELQKILSRLEGLRPTYPIALDVEDADKYKINRGGWNFENVNRNAKYILEGLEAAGYYPMLYTGFEEIENYISEDIWRRFDMWFAHWASKCGYTGDNLSMWQYGGETNIIESNSIPGVGVIDKNICYKDYPTIIKSGGYNGWTKGSTTTESKTKGATAQDIINTAYSLINKDENHTKCDIMAWYGGFDDDVNEEACCCAGQMYLFNKANALNLIPGGKTANCGTLAQNFHKAGQLFKPSEVKPGDLVTFSWSGNTTSVPPLTSLGYKSFDHVELCVEVNGTTIKCIGANNGGAECDDFQIKTRKRSDISACCRPNYADGGEEDTAATVTEAVYGDKNVYEIQQWLNSHFGFDIYIDGVYGNQTKGALTKALQTELNRQSSAGLAVDGIYGPKTAAAVINLRRGSQGDLVQILQGLLIGNGYDTGGLDGDFGTQTDKAVRNFQSDNGLYVDGVAGKATFEELCG